ncbi:MAG: ABC transporter substrate-binding protein [Lachnospiraceae bacterium]|nr:ABC transporter substrate-binding protein [Lachnospiraceae bacterium]
MHSKLIKTAILLLSILTLSACSGQKKTDDGPRVYNDFDISEQVTLNGYVIGSPNPDFGKVWSKVNEMLLRDLNCTMNITYLDWGEYQAQYPLILASGENVDWIFTGHWCMYSDEAAKGAFREISKEDISTYMPRLAGYLPDLAYSQCSLDGKLYMIPSPSPDKKTDVLILRADLADKYGVDLTKVDSFSEIGPYLNAIKENEPEMLPLYLDNSRSLWLNMADEFDGKIEDGYGIGCFHSFDGKVLDDGIYSMFDETIFKAVLNTSLTIRDWQKKGYLNPEALANRVTTRDTFPKGLSGVCLGNFLDTQSVLAEAAANGWETKLILDVNASGHSPMESYSNNGIAISAFSKHPERAMIAMDLIMNEPEYINLIQFGIEGEHYIVTEDGKIDYPEGVSASDTGYNWEETGFWFLNRDLQPLRATWSDEYVNLRERIENEVLKDNPYMGFQLNVNPVQAEYAAVHEIMEQYHRPLELGLTEDVEGAYEKLKTLLYAAGYEKLLSEYQRQFNKYREAIDKASLH